MCMHLLCLHLIVVNDNNNWNGMCIGCFTSIKINLGQNLCLLEHHKIINFNKMCVSFVIDAGSVHPEITEYSVSNYLLKGASYTILHNTKLISIKEFQINVFTISSQPMSYQKFHLNSSTQDVATNWLQTT